MFSYMFSPTASCLFMVVTLIYFLRYAIRRASQNSGRRSFTAQPVKKKDYPYKPENVIQTYGTKRPNSKAAEKRSDRLNQVVTGNLIDTFRAETKVYKNTIASLYGTTYELSMVIDYHTYYQGGAIEEKIPLRFNLADISNIRVYGLDPTYMIIYLRARGGTRKMIFEFEGPWPEAEKTCAEIAASSIMAQKHLLDAGALD